MQEKFFEIFKEILDTHKISYNIDIENEWIKTKRIRLINEADASSYYLEAYDGSGFIEIIFSVIVYECAIDDFMKVTMATNQYNTRNLSTAYCEIDTEYNDVTVWNKQHIILATHDVTEFNSEKLYKKFNLFVHYTDKLNINFKKLMNNNINYTDF